MDNDKIDIRKKKETGEEKSPLPLPVSLSIETQNPGSSAALLLAGPENQIKNSKEKGGGPGDE